MKLVLMFHDPEGWAAVVAERLTKLGVSEEGVRAAVEQILERAKP